MTLEVYLVQSNKIENKTNKFKLLISYCLLSCVDEHCILQQYWLQTVFNMENLVIEVFQSLCMPTRNYCCTLFQIIGHINLMSILKHSQNKFFDDGCVLYLLLREAHLCRYPAHCLFSLVMIRPGLTRLPSQWSKQVGAFVMVELQITSISFYSRVFCLLKGVI